MAQQKNIPIDGNQLERILSERGISHYRLSKATGISETSISRIFSSNSASVYHLRLICESLGIELSEIYRWDDDGSPVHIVEALPPKQPSTDKLKDLFDGFLKLYCIENRYEYSEESAQKLYQDLGKTIGKRFKKRGK